MSKDKVFFLHYGPGGNCDVERHFLGSTYPNLHFWDQPYCSTYKELAEASCDSLQALMKQQKVYAIMGHSFGCDLALAVAEKVNFDGPLYLIAPVFDLPAAFINLANGVLQQRDLAQDVREEVQARLDAFRDSNDLEKLWPLVFATYRYPSIGRLFWKSEKSFQEFAQVASGFKPLNLVVWQRVLSDFMATTASSSRKTMPERPGGRVHVLIGEKDPYFDAEESADHWSQRLGRESVRVSALSGHYPHIEDPVALANLLRVPHPR